MGNLANCPRCGNLFVKSLRPICQDCHNEVEEMFQKVYTFIRERKNRQATMAQVVEATGVPAEEITRFIKEGRLHLRHLPNMEYPCESCGKGIREGRLCTSCQKRIEKELAAYEKEKETQKKDQNRYQTYHSLNNRLKKEENQ